MEEKSTQEWLGVFGRLTENQDFKDAISHLREVFMLESSVFQFGNLPNPTEMLFAREGMRTFCNKLMSMKDELETQLKAEQGDK